MEYLFIIAFVGLIIFKAIKGSGKAKKEEAGKTMLPGKRSVTAAEDKKKPAPDDSWEEWFAGKPRTAETPVREFKTSYKPAVATIIPEKNDIREIADRPEPHSVKSVRLSSKEELRQAILYSEIMNRKY